MFIVDSHQKVLPAWAEYRRSLPEAPRLLTLDHHTDTSLPFRNYLKGAQDAAEISIEMLEQIDFNDSLSVEMAVEVLSNDEHVITALQCDIVSSAFIIAHNARDTDLTVFREHKVICRSVDAAVQKVSREKCDRVLESDFLSEKIRAFDEMLAAAGEAPLSQKPYILDIDLDYFNTLQSIAPRDSTVFRELAFGAGLVTVATEPAYVKSCALDAELTDGHLMRELRTLLASV